MIKINLLSDADKISIKWEKINYIMLLNVSMFIATQLFFALCLLASYEYLAIENEGVDNQLSIAQKSVEAKKIQSIEENVKNYENRLKTINQLQKEHLYWTRSFEALSNIVPEDIMITEFSVKPFVIDTKGKNKMEITDTASAKKDTKAAIDKNKFVIEISGIARKRENMLKLEANLKKSDIFINLVTFDANYVKENNVAFRYTMSINKKSLYY